MKRLIATVFAEEIRPYRVEHHLQSNILNCIDVNDVYVKKMGRKDRQGNIIEDPEFEIDYTWNGHLYDDEEYTKYVIKQLGRPKIKQLIKKVITNNEFYLDLLFRKLHPGKNVYEHDDYDFEEYDLDED